MLRDGGSALALGVLQAHLMICAGCSACFGPRGVASLPHDLCWLPCSGPRCVARWSDTMLHDGCFSITLPDTHHC